MIKKVLRATYGSDKTPLVLGNIEIPCYVLDDGTAVLSGRGMQNILGFTKKDAGSALTSLIKKKTFNKHVSKELTEAINNPIRFMRIGSGGSQPETNGYEATILIDICYVLIDAKNKKERLTPKEFLLASQAEAIVRAFSKTGIVGTIYKLTGYLDNQVSTFLNDIFNKLLLNEAKKYQVTFPLELYKQWFRLNSWEWKPENAQKRPSVLGKWTKDYIYSRMAPQLLKEMERRNPKNEKGYREHKHFQFLTDEIGEPKLREFFGGHLALARSNTSWRKYIEAVNRAFPDYDKTIPLDFPTED